jgi:hypothetical protein
MNKLINSKHLKWKGHGNNYGRNMKEYGERDIAIGTLLPSSALPAKAPVPSAGFPCGWFQKETNHSPSA